MEIKYLIQIKDNKLISYTNLPVIDDGVYNAEVEQELYEDYKAHPNKYIAGEKEIEIEVPEFDDEDNPIMVEVEETITVIDYDDEGNPIGEHEETITKQVQKTHKEKVTVPYPVINPNYEKEEAEKREQAFKQAFFITSLGYVRRSVTMADGNKKDFLSDLLPVISMGVQSGTQVHILTYEEPPFDKDITDWTEYQKQVTVTPQFIQECFMQLSNDFLPINEE